MISSQTEKLPQIDWDADRQRRIYVNTMHLLADRVLAQPDAPKEAIESSGKIMAFLAGLVADLSKESAEAAMTRYGRVAARALGDCP